jgi:protein-disulfide isomerase
MRSDSVVAKLCAAARRGPALALLLAAVLGAAACAGQGGAAPGGGSWAQRYQVFEVDAAGAPARGPEDAPVRIVEFGDFRCRYCRGMLPILERVRAAYPKRVRIAYMHLPVVSQTSARAAIAAVAAQRQGAFWPMHDRLFALQGENLSEALLLAHVSDLGLDPSRFSADLRSPEVEAVVRADLAEAERIGIRGTPAFFVNGRYLPGAQSYGSLVRAIERELEPAGSSAGLDLR